MKILITGGCGFIGASLALYFKKHGYGVYVMDNLVRRGVELNLPIFKEKGIKFFHGDIRCQEDFNLLPKVDFLLECSAQPSAIDGYKNPVFDITNNTYGLLNCLEFARRNEAGLIFWSTNKVYSGEKINAFPMYEDDTRWKWDNPKIRNNCEYNVRGFSPDYGFSNEFDIDGNQHSIYGVSKVCSDLLCQEWSDAFKIPVVVNRFSCLAGPNQWGMPSQGWVAWFAIAVAFGLPIQFIGWGGKQVRDVLFVDDVCRLVELEIKNIDKVKGKVFNVGGGKDISLSPMEAVDLLQKHPKINKYFPNRSKSKVTIVREPRRGDHCIYISDIRKIFEALGWKPKVGIDEGYSQIVEWVKQNEKVLRSLYV